ncbi:MAG: hypothetical protein A2X82_14650 [Geobacteraceae bacterium GWC2_55_20]|nr:MAG: hypothetical protein A2X82_14650 [Geobacteraceae bacterium GWC2_55_20]OGU21357.1 MAG: hypothetical protein A2X85_08215 [Geobacteraceae bacterium GWF2_54_21]
MVTVPLQITRRSARSFLLLLALMAMGFAGNYFALHLFAGFKYLFGSIAVMLVLRIFGIWWAIPAAIAASSWTIVLFGHPYAMIWLCGEALFVGMLVKRETAWNLILCDALYWIFAGSPLIWIFFRYVMDVPVNGTVAAMLMYTVIGITNALAASLALTVFSPREAGGVMTCSPPPISMQSLLFNVLMTIVAIPALIVMILHVRNSEEFRQHELYESLFDSSRVAGYELRLATRNSTAVPVDELQEILLKSRIRSNQKLILTDRAGRVLASTDNSLLPGSIHDPLKSGEIRPVAEYGIVQRLPLPASPLPLWQRTMQSVYIHKSELGGGTQWLLTIETPYAPYQALIISDQINSLLLLLLFNLLALAISVVMSRRLTAPMRILSQVTTDLPERLMREKISSWPVSRVAEVDQLISNFRDMSKALSHRFQEITYINETLELRVEERTKQLSRANEELQKEIVERQMTARQRDHLMEELINHVRFLQTLIDAIPNSIFYMDSNGLYQGCNRSFEEKWGLSREEIVGKTVYDLFPRQDAEIFDRANRQLSQEGGVQIYETQLSYNDKSLHSVIFYKATYQDTSGKTDGLVGTIIDITDRKKAETDRDRLMVELQQKNKELEGIVYVASHDLRSPLVNVQGFSRRLAKSCAEIDVIISALELPREARERLSPILSASIPKSLGFITSSVEKMDALLSGLLRLSRLGRAAICFEQLDMHMLVSNIIESMAFQIESASATINVEKLAGCLADRVQMGQIFSNLIDNAIKYRSAERALVVRVSSEEFSEGVRYCVEDNGIGIPFDQQDKIWEIFNRLNPDNTPGEGLGLTMARRIIDRLGGSIWVESETDVGSRFYVVLPKSQGRAQHG